MNGDRLRLAILGASHWHMPRQVEAFIKAGVRITAVQDDDSVVAHQWANRLDARAYPVPDQAMEQADAVLIMARPSQTPQLVEAAIERQMPFAVEKPGACRAALLNEQAERATASQIPNAVAFVNRYGSFWPTVQRYRDEGRLAGPLVARFRIVNGTPQRYIDDGVPWVLEQNAFGGGALRNIGAHAADAAVTLLGAEPRIFGAETSSAAFGLEVDDHALALLGDDLGNVVTVEAGYRHPRRSGTDHEWSVSTPNMIVTETDQTLSIETADRIARPPTPDMQRRYDLFAADAAAAFAGGFMPKATIADAVRALALVDRIYGQSVPTQSTQ